MASGALFLTRTLAALPTSVPLAGASFCLWSHLQTLSFTSNHRRGLCVSFLSISRTQDSNAPSLFRCVEVQAHDNSDWYQSAHKG